MLCHVPFPILKIYVTVIDEIHAVSYRSIKAFDVIAATLIESFHFVSQLSMTKNEYYKRSMQLTITCDTIV